MKKNLMQTQEQEASPEAEEKTYPKIKENSNLNYTYMLLCGDGSYYVGWTNNLEKRLKTHQAGKGGKYTRTHLPVELAYYEAFDTKQEAQSREWHLKRLSHTQKIELIKKGTDLF